MKTDNEGEYQWYLKTYLAALEDNGNDANADGEVPDNDAGAKETKVAQVI